MRQSTIVALAGLGALTACNAVPPVPPRAAVEEAPVAIPATPDSLGVRLLDAGSAPRERIRFHPTAQGQESMTVESDFTIDSSGALEFSGGSRMKLVFRSIATESAPGGKVSRKFWIVESTLTDARNATPDMREGLAQEVARMRGATITYTMNDRGALDPPSVIEADGGPSPSSSYTPMNAARLAENQIVLPEQPIGVGARWELGRESVETGTMHFADTFTFELVARRGDRIEVKFQRARTAVLGKPPESRLLSGQGEGEGVVSIDLARFFPVAARIRSGFDTESKLDAGTVTSHRRLGLTIDDVGQPR